ncbi:hypothetical protein BaRGS_00001056, partial [Batillaria attramentaria]
EQLEETRRARKKQRKAQYKLNRARRRMVERDDAECNQTERTLLSQSLTLTHLTLVLGLGRCLKDLAVYVEHYQLLLREPEVTRADELHSLQAF